MTGISTLGQSLTQIERLKNLQAQLADFQRQIASGKKAELFSGLGTDVLVSKRARADFNQLETYINNIENGDRRAQLMTVAVEEIREQANNLMDAMAQQVQEGDMDLQTIGDLASNIRGFLETLMNSRDGDRFLLAGADALSQPYTNTGAMDTYMQTQIGDWVNSNIDTDQLIASYRDKSALTDSLVGYSAGLSSGNSKDVFVRVEDNDEINLTVRANESHFRDILVVTGMIENLARGLDKVTLDEGDPSGTVTAPGADTKQQNENFFALFNDLASLMNGALDQVDNTLFRVGQAQAQMGQIKENHEIEKNILLDQISTVEDADMNEVAVQLNSLQIQLEASFRVTAAVRSLSLVNFL